MNVRVAARVRPLLPKEKATNCCSCVTVHAETRQVVVGTRRAFAFDMVFDVGSTQEEVYEGCVSSLLDGCLQGYNATILAYGQTGSGKTHSMGTGQVWVAEASENEGITPKVIRNSFDFLEKHRDEVDFQASCCYIEIYNEEIRDLLQPGAQKGQIAVRERSDGVIQLVGIHAEACNSAADMLRCLNDGSVNRTTGATLMNEQSSRSHSIFTLILEQRIRRRSLVGDGAVDNAEAATSYRTAKFHLVDLAGSERAKRTGAVGSRFKESVSINAGLLALGNVISALGDPAKRGSHVPYRESKLTRLLQDSLGGNSRTLMLACASCADSDFEETLTTLKYANRARNIKNTPVVNHDPQVAQLAALQDENEALRRELRRVAEGSPGASPGSAGGAAMGTGVAAPLEATELQGVSDKLEASESRCTELVQRLAGVEGECDSVRRSLADVYGSVCHHLPAIWHAPGVAGGSASAEGNARVGRQALSAICEALQTARRILGDLAPDLVHGDSLGQQLMSLQPVGRESGGGEELPGRGRLESLDLADDSSLANESLSHGDGEGRLRTLSEMRRDSTLLIRKYLDEMKRLETELTLYRRRTKQLEEEVREAKDDLQKDEEIFEEKCAELKVLADQNEELRTELWEAMQSHSRVDSARGESMLERPSRRTSWVEGMDESRPEDSELGLGGQSADETIRGELRESRTSRSAQQRLEQELQILGQNVTVKEELIRELVHSEREWGATKAQYQQRMEQLQSDLDRMQSELRVLQEQLAESQQLKEHTKQMEEEKRQLEHRIMDQLECIRKRQSEFARLRELRHQDGRKIKELEAEVQGLRGNQRELDRKLQTERKREAQQISELQRRLQKEGQRIRDLEAENLRHRDTLKRQSKQPDRVRSATPLSRKGSGTHIGAPEVTGTSWAGTAGHRSASSSTSRVQHLERHIDDYVKRRQDNAAQGLAEDLKKQEALLKKREQYMLYRDQIAAKNMSETAQAQPPDERQRAENMLREIDDRMEALQDEIDFREARIAKAQHEMRPGSGGGGGAAALFDAEFSGVTLDDAKAVLERCCEKMIRLRQREKQAGKRLAANEAQIDEKARRVAELETVLKRHDSNSTRAMGMVTKKYEEQIRALLQQLGSAQQSAVELDLQRSLILDKSGSLRADALADATAASASAGVGAGGSGGSRALPPPRDAPAGALAEAEAEIQRLLMDNQFFQAQTRELKRKLRAEREKAGGAGTAQPTDDHLAASVASSCASPHFEELASQVQRLEKEKELLCEENERVKTQILNLKQYQYRFHNISSVSVSQSELVPRSPPSAPGAKLLLGAAVASAAAAAASLGPQEAVSPLAVSHHQASPHELAGPPRPCRQPLPRPGAARPRAPVDDPESSSARPRMGGGA